MGNVIVFKKFLFAYALYSALPPIAEVVQSTASSIALEWISIVVVLMMMGLTVLPELVAKFSGDLLEKIIKSMEDENGKFNFREFIGLYGTFLVLRTFIFGYLYMMIDGWDPEPQVLYSPLAFVASTGILSFLKRKPKD